MLLAALAIALIILVIVKNRRICLPSAEGKICVVRRFENRIDALNLIAEVKRRNGILLSHRANDFPRLKRNYNPDKMFEVDPTNLMKFTAYVYDKGKQYGLCVRQTEDNSPVDINTVMYVDLHELAHLESEEDGHGSEFKLNFRRLLQAAIVLGLYKPVNYDILNERYCGLDIDQSILYPKSAKN